MFYEDIKNLPSEKFKCLTGVRPKVFDMMLSAVQEAKARRRKHPTRGRPTKLELVDKMLMTLFYRREYRTQKSLSITYGVSEGTVCEGIKEIENILMEESRFHLPGKKVLWEGGTAIKTVLVDATECPVERPKKNSGQVTRIKRSVTHRRFSF